MDETLLQFFQQCDNLFLYVLYAHETLDLMKCILLRHCHNIKEMVAQKKLPNLEKDRLAIKFHM